jgi:dTDP-4-amino-4,6-dideoxygalactose transaminase
LYNKLKEFNIFARKYFYPLCSQQPCYASLPSAHITNLPIATTVSRDVLCLPMYGALTDETVVKICVIVNGLLTGAIEGAV